jgi:hypothetical protein
MRAPAPPLWEMRGAATGEVDPHAQSTPEYEFEQHIVWLVLRARRRTSPKPKQDVLPLPVVKRHVSWVMCLAGLGGIRMTF